MQVYPQSNRLKNQTAPHMLRCLQKTCEQETLANTYLIFIVSAFSHGKVHVRFGKLHLPTTPFNNQQKPTARRSYSNAKKTSSRKIQKF
jgi:hypothetical protein